MNRRCVVCAPWMNPQRRAASAYRAGPALLAWVLAVLLAASLRVAPAATDASPRDLVIDTSERMLAAIKSERDLIRRNPEHVYELVRDIVLPHFDFETMSRWVLGKYWRSATPDQQQRFSEEFRTLLVRTYAVSLAQYEDQTITYEPLQAAPDATDVTVRTDIERHGSTPIPIAYSMHRKNGEWSVYDVTIDGVSLVTNYRSTFATEIRQGGLDALIERLAERNRTSGS